MGLTGISTGCEQTSCCIWQIIFLKLQVTTESTAAALTLRKVYPHVATRACIKGVLAARTACCCRTLRVHSPRHMQSIACDLNAWHRAHASGRTRATRWESRSERVPTADFCAPSSGCLCACTAIYTSVSPNLSTRRAACKPAAATGDPGSLEATAASAKHMPACTRNHL